MCAHIFLEETETRVGSKTFKVNPTFMQSRFSTVQRTHSSAFEKGRRAPTRSFLSHTKIPSPFHATGLIMWYLWSLEFRDKWCRMGERGSRLLILSTLPTHIVWYRFSRCHYSSNLEYSVKRENILFSFVPALVRYYLISCYVIYGKSIHVTFIFSTFHIKFAISVGYLNRINLILN